MPSESITAPPLQQWSQAAAPDVRLPGYDRAAVTAGMAHIGVGNFSRVHLARYVDDCLHLPGQSDWGIVGIGVRKSPRGKAKAAAYTAQDCLYTVTEYALHGARSLRVIGAMIDYRRYGPDDPTAVLELLASPAVRIVSMTLTEGGHFRDESTDAFDPDHPDIARDVHNPLPGTVFGLLVAALRRRRREGTAPFTVVSCDNLRGNGRTARQALAGFARTSDPEFADCIESTVAFPDSMVDRTAPTVNAQSAQRVRDATEIVDAVPAVAGSFSQWVIQDRFPAGRPGLGEVGVQLRDDVAEFETFKGRVLNASHMMLCFPVLLMGNRLVHEAMRDDRRHGLLRRFLERDVVPFVQAPPRVSLREYVDSVLERFANPAVSDQLLRIAADGSSKIPTFHTRTMHPLLNREADISREAFLLAAYRRSLGGADDVGASYQVDEPAIPAADWALLRSLDPVDALSASPFAALHLGENGPFVQRYRELVDHIAVVGTGEAMEQLLESQPS